MADNDLKVIVKAKELMAHSLKISSNSNRFPKKFRHSLCDRIQNYSMDIYMFLVEANRTDNVRQKRERCETITKAILRCDELLALIEVSMTLDILNDKSVEYWSKMVLDVKYMSLAWRKKERQ